MNIGFSSDFLKHVCNVWSVVLTFIFRGMFLALFLVSYKMDLVWLVFNFYTAYHFCFSVDKRGKECSYIFCYCLLIV